MRSSTFSSELRLAVAFVATLGILVSSWEVILRNRAGATANVGIASPRIEPTSSHGDEYVVFGNCLMMTGVSPKMLDEELGSGNQVVVNIASHEQSPIAFFEYLRRANHYPRVIVTNVSSWLNGTNFDQHGALVIKIDRLGLLGKAAPAGAPALQSSVEAFHEGSEGSGAFQRSVEARLSERGGAAMQAVGHRYHLFDYALFLGALAKTRDLDESLYQLNMQAWFRVAKTETDGRGFLGLDVRYRDDWGKGLERMADRSLQRLRLSHLLTERYWALLERDVREFQGHGTEVLFVRMPEHPRIKKFNDETYAIADRLRTLEERTGAPSLDLSALGPSDGVRLFDAVHPDAPAARVISTKVGAWLRERRGRVAP